MVYVRAPKYDGRACRNMMYVRASKYDKCTRVDMVNLRARINMMYMRAPKYDKCTRMNMLNVRVKERNNICGTLNLGPFREYLVDPLEPWPALREYLFDPP